MSCIHVAKKVYVGIVYHSYHSPPCGGGARGWGLYTKKRTTRITRTGLSKNNVNQCPILSNMNKI